MTTFRSILCAVDHSAAAARVVRPAAGVASVFGAPLTVLTVTSGAPAAAETALREQVRAALPEGAPMPELRVVKLAMGAVVDALLDAVEASDLIVTGTHSKSGLSRWLLGSTSAALLAETPCPALLVPPGTVDLVESLGAETLIHVRMDSGAQLIARQSLRTALRHGDKVGVFVAAANAHRFDAQGRAARAG